MLLSRISLVSGVASKMFRTLSSYTNTKERKRFYKEVYVTEASTIDGRDTKKFEINLDQRKLKTPGGQAFTVDNELLAKMIANEWRSQHTHIKLNTMHLTSLTNTTIDNPNRITSQDLVRNINDYLVTDTLLFFDNDESTRLLALQEREWRPLVDWFNSIFSDSALRISRAGTSLADMSPLLHTSTFNQYLVENFTLSTLIAFNYMVECIKSVILSVALLERRIDNIDRCLALTLLEQSHQYEQWGKVEWYHDIQEQEMRARVSAALLFIYLSSESKYLVNRNIKSFKLERRKQ